VTAVLADVAFSWANLPGKPFVTVSPIGGALPNNGADFGPNTAGTTTNGIQEAINSLPANGGVVYCLAGGYTISSTLHNTGSFQVVIFAAGAILGFQPGGTYANSDLNGHADILVGTTRTPSEANFHDCYWYGNGALVTGSGINDEIVFAAQHGGSHSAPPLTPGYRLVVDGFTISNIGNTSFLIGAQNYAANVTYANQIRQVRFSRISATWKPGTTGASGCAVQGSAREIILADLNIDTSNVAAGTQYSNLFIRAASGDTEDVVVARSTFINNQAGNVFDIQGNASRIDGSVSRSCFNIRLEDCVFDSKQVSPTIGYAGSGGGWIDDNDRTGNTGYVYNVEFTRCEFGPGSPTSTANPPNVGITFQTYLSFFGYIRFSEGSVPAAFSGAPLLGRGPGDAGVAITFNASHQYINLDGFEERVILSGGGAISLNGSPTGLTTAVLILRDGDYVTSNPTPTTAIKQPM
jgi:hypothetical protein